MSIIGPLANGITEAVSYLEEGHASGKVIIDFDQLASRATA